MIIKKKKIVIFFSAGLGNAVLLVPLMNKLKEEYDTHITILLNSVYVNKDFLTYNNFPFNSIIELNNRGSIKFIVQNFRKFDCSYLDYSGSSVKNLFLARMISKKVNAMRKNTFSIPYVNFVKPSLNTHAAILGINLLNVNFKKDDFILRSIFLKNKIESPIIINEMLAKGKIPISIQISSANLSVRYKNWPTNYWIEFLKMVIINFPNVVLILLGDENEVLLGNEIASSIPTENTIDLTAKTNLKEVSQIIKHSSLYIGLDSGLMHLAVAYDIPTFSIFGASSYDFVGYEQFDKTKHRVVYNPIECWPCHGFVGTNQSNVENPKDCKDISCLIGLSPKFVFSSFSKFFKETNIYINSEESKR